MLTIEIVMFLTYELQISELHVISKGNFSSFQINGKFFEGVRVEFFQLTYYAN